MKTLSVAVGGLLVLVAAAANAADSGARTYPNPSCSDRNANPENCLVQDGPSRRGSGGETPAPPETKDTPVSKLTGASAGKGVPPATTTTTGGSTGGTTNTTSGAGNTTGGAKPATGTAQAGRK